MILKIHIINGSFQRESVKNNKKDYVILIPIVVCSKGTYRNSLGSSVDEYLGMKDYACTFPGKYINYPKFLFRLDQTDGNIRNIKFMRHTTEIFFRFLNGESNDSICL